MVGEGRLSCCPPAVNYRGSLGFGQDSVASLPGNVGTQDVCDVQVWPWHVVLTPGCLMLLWVPQGGKVGPT